MNGTCMMTTGQGGQSGSGQGQAGQGGSGQAGSGQAGAAGGSAGRGGSGAGGSGAAGSTGTGGTPAGYWIYTDSSPSYTWNGCVWTGVDSTVAGSTTNFTMPSSKDFTSQAGTSGPYRVAGSVFSNYDAVALLGFNIAQPAASANCVYRPVTTGDPPMPATPLPSGTTGIAINWGRSVGSQFRIQIQGPNGANDANDRWCYNIADAGGPSFAPYAMFNTKCWDNTGTYYPATNLASKPISAIVFLVPGTTAVQSFDFTINGFAAGTSASDAPTGGMVIPSMGTIGGAGSTDLDFQRVKVRAGGKDYIIQNNNWGNPGGSNQTLMYRDNSFTITSPSGTGASAPASFPSIYIGGNGNVAGGSFSTHPGDNLPKRVSDIGTINTKLTVNRASGDMNVAYDVWFNAVSPNFTQYPYSGYPEYDDGVSGFVMVWFYDPPGHQPIGSSVRTFTTQGKTFNVWVGPRGGGGSNANAPVVSYVATAPFTTWTFDLKPFVADASAHGIQSSWYLTDIFAGAEIWNGGDSNGWALNEFTCAVQ
jgi:hypothetical protein